MVWFALAFALLQQQELPAPTFVAPKLLHFVHAPAPPSLGERGEVDVVLNIDVDETGKVTEVVVEQSGGEDYDAAAVAAARQFEFAPGQADGKPVPVKVTFKYRFVAPKPPAAPAPPKIETVPFAGTIKSRGDRIPQPGVSVVIDGGPLRANTDDDGHFAFDAVPVGAHTVHLRGPTVGAIDLPLLLAPGKRTDVTWYVTVTDRYSTVVHGHRVTQEAVEQTLGGEEFRKIPGTQGDTLKAVQNLPGVARSPFGGGLLVVWGSAPQDTRTYVNGVYIPTLYHFGGLRSTVNGEMIQSLTFLPGGYGAAYGRGLGGVIELESREPRADSPHGFVQMDLIDGSFLFDGPLTKDVSLAVGARRSWIDVFLPLFTTNDFQLEPIYWDYQTELHWKVTPRDELTFFLFGSDDTLHLLVRRPDPQDSPVADSHTFYHRALTEWLHRFGGGATLTLTASAGYDVPFQFSLTEGNTTRQFDIETFEYNLRAAGQLPVRKWLRLDGGVDFEGNAWPIDVTFGPSGPPREGDPGGFGGGAGDATRLAGLIHETYTLATDHTAPWLSATIKGGGLAVTPQLRVDAFHFGAPANHTYVEVEPRLTARYQLTPMVAPKIAVGLYHEAPGVLDWSSKFGNPNLSMELGLHYVAGADIDPTPSLHIEVEGFYKDLRDLVVRGEHAGDPLLVNDGVGRVYGGEVLVRKLLTRHFFGWVAYTLSRSERQDHPDLPWRLFQYDQTHILTVIGSYLLPRGYQLGARFRYVTGSPYTPVTSAYYDSNVDRYIPIFGPVYSGRLDSFNQLDIRMDKAWTFDKWKLALYLDVQNVYNRQNPEALRYNFNFRQTDAQAGLPFLPVVGIRGEL